MEQVQIELYTPWPTDNFPKVAFDNCDYANLSVTKLQL